jgi:hypothetical protein
MKMSASDTPTGMVERLSEQNKTIGKSYFTISKGKSSGLLPVVNLPVIKKEDELPLEVIDMDKLLPQPIQNEPRELIAFQFSNPKRKNEGDPLNDESIPQSKRINLLVSDDV